MKLGVVNKAKNLLTEHKNRLISILTVLLIALVIRLLTFPFIPTELVQDNSTYLGAAEEILEGKNISSMIVMPLYPLLLALFGGGETSLLIVGIITGLISVALVWALAGSLFASEKVKLGAAGMMAIYPMSIFYSGVGLTENLFSMFILAAFLSLNKNRSLLASIFFVLSILVRPVMDLYAPIVIVWHALVVRKLGTFRAVCSLLIYGLVYILMMAPWWLHNTQKYNHFVRLNYGFGVVLYAGNNPMNISGGGVGGVDFSPKGLFDDFTLPLHEPARSIEMNRLFQDIAIDYICQNPVLFFEMAAVKFVRFWSLIPYAPTVKANANAYIATLSLLPVLLLAFATLITRRQMFVSLTPILGFVVYLTLTHMITIGSIRYRFPLEPLLIVIAAPSLVRMWDFIFTNRKSA
jgi:hypothetical protein